MDNFAVKLKDLITNQTVDLKSGEYAEFSVPTGLVEGRFILAVSNTTTDVTDSELSGKKFSVYSSSGYINIFTLTNDFENLSGAVNVYNITGRKLYQKKIASWPGSGNLEQIPIKGSSEGILIVEIEAGKTRYVEKVNVKQ